MAIPGGLEEAILDAPPVDLDRGMAIGRSREGRTLRAFRFGRGGCRVSLLAGCHADEPVGPRTLRRLCGYLMSIGEDHPALADCDWWIIPHINPDGAVRNRGWQPEGAESYDVADHLADAVREQPGDDIEFGFPRGPDDERARPENRAAYDWWRSSGGPFDLHVSLHGMAFAGGPWFLIDAAWRDRCHTLKQRCRTRVRELGYVLHDVERRGEKGFFRIERGFCTRPDSRYMQQHFLERGDEETAGRFRPSSMEAIRSLGGDALTLVSEMPLFITPGVGANPGPPDPVAEMWRRRIEDWRERLAHGADRRAIAREAAEAGLRPMPVRDQMALQWTFIAAGLEQLASQKPD